MEMYLLHITGCFLFVMNFTDVHSVVWQLLTGCLLSDIWCTSTRRCRLKGCRAWIGRKRENESESGKNPEAQHECVH